MIGNSVTERKGKRGKEKGKGERREIAVRGENRKEGKKTKPSKFAPSENFFIYATGVGNGIEAPVTKKDGQAELYLSL